MFKSNELRYLALISQLGLIMIGSILMGFGLGYFLDERFSVSPVFTFIFLGIGILAGFFAVYRIIIREIEKK